MCVSVCVCVHGNCFWHQKGISAWRQGLIELNWFCLFAVYGGSLYGNSGQIVSPNYPNRYDRNDNIVWMIAVSSGMRVRLTFTAFLLEGSTSYNCPHDYILVSFSSSCLSTFCLLAVTWQILVSMSSNYGSKAKMDLNSFLRCTQLNAPCTGPWRGDLQERMRRCFGLFLSTAVMTHRAPSPMWGLPASSTVGLFVNHHSLQLVSSLFTYIQ